MARTASPESRWAVHPHFSAVLLSGVALLGSASCGLRPPPSTSGLDLSDLQRTGFSRFSLAGRWSASTSEGQSRVFVFDGNGELTALTLPDGSAYQPQEGDVVSVTVTSFGAVAIEVRADTEASDGVVTLHEFEGMISDDGDRIRGTALRVADDLSAGRAVTLRETWVKVD